MNNQGNKIKTILIILISVVITAHPFTYGNTDEVQNELMVRKPVDPVGFVRFDWQMEKFMKRIEEVQADQLQKALKKNNINNETKWKVVISPHDDHAYVGYLYPAVLKNLNAGTIILFGVAHKAKDLGLEDRFIFDEYKSWHGPYGPVKVSGLRSELIRDLPMEVKEVNNRMHKIEHSIEALIPFIQYYNRDVEIVPILVPYMSYKRMTFLGKKLADAITIAIKKRNWKWGKDFAIAISSDSVHYGDSDWGGKNFARFGSDKKGYENAIALESEIINKCLIGTITKNKIRTFTEYTVKKDNYKEYKWTWCGRYSIPAGLMTAYYLSEKLSVSLKGVKAGYRTSITLPPLEVKDLKIGFTAPANLHHWVGYTAIGYK